MAIGTMSEKGWIVIPKQIREELGLTKGRKVVIFKYGDRVTIAPLSHDPIGEARGMFEGTQLSTQRHRIETKQEEHERDAKFARFFPKKH